MKIQPAANPNLACGKIFFIIFLLRVLFCSKSTMSLGSLGNLTNSEEFTISQHWCCKRFLLAVAIQLWSGQLLLRIYYMQYQLWCCPLLCRTHTGKGLKQPVECAPHGTFSVKTIYHITRLSFHAAELYNAGSQHPIPALGNWRTAEQEFSIRVILC